MCSVGVPLGPGLGTAYTVLILYVYVVNIVCEQSENGKIVYDYTENLYDPLGSPFRN